MSRYLNAVSQATSTVRVQRWTIGVLGLIALVAILNAKFKDTQLTAHIPPDLSNGAAVKIGGKPEVPAPNVYAFGMYMWQQVNNWPTDGAQDYGKQIFAWQHYITPACREQLKADLKIKGGNGELVTRTRAMMEIPGQGFAANRVTNHGNGSWTVLLDLALIETSRGLRVKDAAIRYPLRVVRYDATREDNAWGLAIDCFGDRHPERLERSEPKPVEPAPTPSTAVPSILPQPLDPLPSARGPAESTAAPSPPATTPTPPAPPAAKP
jgi:integrating conjugative element protein (TIGR03746 family)